MRTQRSQSSPDTWDILCVPVVSSALRFPLRFSLLLLLATGDGERLRLVPVVATPSLLASPAMELLTTPLFVLLDSAASNGSSGLGETRPGGLAGESARYSGLSGSSGYSS